MFREQTAEQRMSDDFFRYTGGLPEKKIKALKWFIEDHGHKCYGLNDKGLLHVAGEAVLNGEVTLEDAYIKPTLSAVRDWLGY